MADDPALRYFADEYLPNVEQATVTYERWRKQQPGEHVKWVAFRDAVLRGEQVEPPSMSTRKGRELVAAGKEHMAISRLVGQMVSPLPQPTPDPPPPPEPPPPADPYTYRFSTFNTTTDKITGTLNRASNPADTGTGAHNWWIPGTPYPPSGWSAWSADGGLTPVTHPTYGPGIKIVTTPSPECPYVGGSRVSRYVIDDEEPPFVGGENLGRFPTTNGSIHRWDFIWQWPTSGNPSGWPSGSFLEGTYYGHWINGTQNVGHHLFLNNNFVFPSPPMTYYVGVHTGQGTGLGTWTRINGPAFLADTYHEIRFEIKWSTGADGYIKAWTGINGAAQTQWCNYVGVTKPAGFTSIYTHYMNIRPTQFFAAKNTLNVYNHRLTLL